MMPPATRHSRTVRTVDSSAIVSGESAGNIAGSSFAKASACRSAAMIPMNPVTDPTDRSMFPVTMTRTIPIARNEMIVIWRNRFDRFWG